MTKPFKPNPAFYDEGYDPLVHGTRPSNRWSKKNKFLNAQADMFRSEHNVALIERISDLSPAEKRRLIVAAPAFVAGERSL